MTLGHVKRTEVLDLGVGKHLFITSMLAVVFCIHIFLCVCVSFKTTAGKQTYVTAAEFLQRAGQGHLVAQYEKLEQELNQAMHQRRKQLNHCMEKLQLYCSVAVKVFIV